MPSVLFPSPAEMNLLGYFLKSLIEKNIQTQIGKRTFIKMKGRILINASGMEVSLDFSNDKLEISVGRLEKPSASVKGQLNTLLNIALGKGMIRPVLTGKLKVTGKIWRLLPLIKLLKASTSYLQENAQ
jgi:hypothetical protein